MKASQKSGKWKTVALVHFQTLRICSHIMFPFQGYTSCLFKVKGDAKSCGRFYSTPLVSLKRIKGLFPFKCKCVSIITVLYAVALPVLNPLINTVNPNWWNNDKRKAQFAQRLQYFVNQYSLWHFIPSEITWAGPEPLPFSSTAHLDRASV